jgi:hypothetical protein
LLSMLLMSRESSSRLEMVLLAPAVPFLVGVAKTVSDEVAKAAGKDVWSEVKAKLGGKLAGHAIA